MSAPEQTALVTGANRGLGLATCRELARRGFRVLLTSRTERGEAASERLAAEGLPVAYQCLDVADPASIAALAQWLRRDAIRLDALVNNAGIMLRGLDAEIAAQTLAVNFHGPVRVTEALLPSIPDGGTVVMVSSGLGELSCFSPTLREQLADPALTRERLVMLMQAFVEAVKHGRAHAQGWPESAYRVSKAGLNAFVRILSRELAPRHIRVNAVCPGWVRTEMGGARADRSVEQGVESIVWAVTPEQAETGGFYRDGTAIPW
ncbi:MAG: SDR family oxidoreductase [Candidatus Schekmanbacteria bacterium]|nr:SDR family oxidoreductase [Candidatus Schekmanbacteria bacterium]